MISRAELITTLNSLKTEENGQYIERYISVIESLDDDSLQAKLNDLKIKNVRHVKKFVDKNISIEQQSKFTNLNDLISYGRKRGTLHIHVVPTDLHNMLSSRGIRTAELQLIDALEQIQTMLKTDKKFRSVKQIYAVSGLIARPITRIFENLNFEVKSMRAEQAKEDPELSKFYEMFKDKKYIGSAKLSREILLSEEWDKAKNDRKQTLKKMLDKNLITDLKSQVMSEVITHDIKADIKEIAKTTNDMEI